MIWRAYHKHSSVIEKQEKQTRRDNMMFFGVKENVKETGDITELNIRGLLETTLKIPQC